MEGVFFDTPPYREFAQLDAHTRLPDESTILRFRHRLHKHKMGAFKLRQQRARFRCFLLAAHKQRHQRLVAQLTAAVAVQRRIKTRTFGQGVC